MSTSGLARILIKEGLLTSGDCQLIASDYAHSGASFAKIVVAMGILTDESLAQFLAHHTRLEQLPHPDPCPFQEEVRYKIDGPLIERLEVVPLSLANNTLKVAMVDPLDRETMAQLKFFTPYRIKPVIASFSSIYATLQHFTQDFHPASSSLQSILSKKVVAMPRVQASTIAAPPAEVPAQLAHEDDALSKANMSLEDSTNEFETSHPSEARNDEFENLAPDEPELPPTMEAAPTTEPAAEEIAAEEASADATMEPASESVSEAASEQPAAEPTMELTDLGIESEAPIEEPVPAMAGAPLKTAEVGDEPAITSTPPNLGTQSPPDMWSDTGENSSTEQNVDDQLSLEAPPSTLDTEQTEEAELSLEEPMETLAEEMTAGGEHEATDDQEETMAESEPEGIHPDLMNAVVDDALGHRPSEDNEIFGDLKEDLNLEPATTLEEPHDDILPLDGMLDHEDVIDGDTRETAPSHLDIPMIASKLNYGLARFSLSKDPGALVDFATLELMPRGLATCLLIKTTPSWHKVLGWDGNYVDNADLAAIQDQIAKKVASMSENVLTYMPELGESTEGNSLQPFAARLKGKEPHLAIGFIHSDLANSPVICDLLIKLLRRFT